MGMFKTDSKLREDILEELEWEPSINATEIGVAVKDGVVTLSGYVASYAEKRAAEQAAARVSGVKAIAEEIKVKLPGSSIRPDADIAKAALDAIKWHTLLPDNRLKVKVESGVATLEGDVDWQYQRNGAAEAVRHLTGVKSVVNLIKVKPPITSYGVKEKIRRALERTADEEAGQITVAVNGSEITLGGHVKTWVERQDAVRAAWAAPGVTMVHNHIDVKPPMYA